MCTTPPVVRLSHMRSPLPRWLIALALLAACTRRPRAEAPSPAAAVDSLTPVAPLFAPAFARAADSLARRDARQDADAALRRHDVRLLALDAHYGVWVPGVPEKSAERLLAACGQRVLADPAPPYGEVDGSPGREAARFRTVAAQYAATYNEAVLADRRTVTIAVGCRLT